MKEFTIFAILISSSLAIPAQLFNLQSGGLPFARYAFAAAPVGPDGRVVDTPEVTAAKVQHEVAQENQRIKLADEAAKTADPVIDATPNPAAILASTVPATIPSPGAAPLGPDGTVVDTPEVTKSKVDHAVAQINERLKLIQEKIRVGELPLVPSILNPATIFPAPIPIITQIVHQAIPQVNPVIFPIY